MAGSTAASLVVKAVGDLARKVSIAVSAMTRLINLLPAILALPLCVQAAEPQMFKCKDAAGRITYAGRECSELGLSSAGEVKGRVMVTPALKVPAAPPAATDAAARDAATPSKSSDGAPANPARRCFKTAKGERCDDVPE